jgi:ThiF family
MNAETIYRRQLDIIPMERLQKAYVTVIGCGAVGSFTAFTLAKMGVGSINVYDPDRVEIHNIPNQMFSVGDCGLYKAEALRDMVELFHGVEIDACPVKYTDQPLSGIVIVAVDSMDARIAIWRKVKYNAAVKLFIDSRMGAEVGRIIAVELIDPLGVEFYQSTLHTSAEAFQAPCTEKSTVYCACGLAAMICAKVKKHLAGDPYEKSLTIDYRQAILLQQ